MTFSRLDGQRKVLLLNQRYFHAFRGCAANLDEVKLLFQLMGFFTHSSAHTLEFEEVKWKAFLHQESFSRDIFPGSGMKRVLFSFNKL